MYGEISVPSTQFCCKPKTALKKSLLKKKKKRGFPSSDGKESTCNAGDPGSIPGPGRSPGEENGNPIQCLAWTISWTEDPGRLQSWWVGCELLQGVQSRGGRWSERGSGGNPGSTISAFHCVVLTPISMIVK